MLTLRTLSKAYGLAGLRVGYAVGDPHVITALRKVAIPFALNSLAQAAALAALAAKDGSGTALAAGRRRAGPGDRRPARRRFRGSDLAGQLRLAAAAGAGRRFAAHCEEHKVIVRAFPDAAGGVRVTIGCPEENDVFLAAAAGFPR